MNPAFLDNMSWEMAEVYGAVTDQILINLAHYFPYYKPGDIVPRSSFTYQADMLAQMGQINKETIGIILRNLGDADGTLRRVMNQAIVDAVNKANPPLWGAAMQGIVSAPKTPIVTPNQMRAYQLYYQQAAQKLNLVNTVMLESTQQAYQATVADIANRIQVTQTALDIVAGETITGVSTWNQATQHAINRMTANGITGFIDHGGHHWSAEAYVAMDIRTTVFNTGRAAVWETNQNFGNDLYQVSYHNGARPLCYPWQNKVISSTDNARTVVDLDGNEIHVYAQSETSFGEAAGLFGVNCKHYPNPFIPGVSVIRGEPQDEEANAKTYAESQEQRRLERTLREEKRDLMMLKAQGAPEEMIAAQQERVRQRSADIQDFCDSTGRARHRDREGVYTKREFPAADTYDVAAFTREQQNLYNKYWKSGGAQVDYNNVSGMVPNMAVPATPQNVAQQATQTPNVGVQSNPGVMSVRDFAEYKRYMKDTHGIEVTAGVGRLDFDMVKEATSGFESVAKDFPEVTKNVKKVRLSKSGVMSCNGEEITFNSDYFTDRTVMDDAIDRCTRTNWWRKGATVSSIGAHETAHAVEAVLIEKSGKYQSQFAKVNAWNNGTEARDIVKEACDELLKLPQNSGKSAFELIKDQISGYGAKGGNSETMAEAFADVNAVGANATPLAQAIVRITQKKYNQYLGVIP